MLEARESAATFAKLTPLQPKIAALRKLILSQLGEGTLMRYLLLPFTPRYILFTIAILGTFTLAAIGLRNPGALPALALPLAAFGALVLLGICDLIQTRHAILRNYPIAAHIRFILEHIRPELRQYSSRLRGTARPSRATSAPSSISAPSNSSTRAPSAPITTFTAIIMSGCIIRSSRSSRRRSSSAPRSAGRNARSPTRHPCSTSRP